MDIVERFLTYAKVNTQSDETSGIVPSTLSQMDSRNASPTTSAP